MENYFVEKTLLDITDAVGLSTNQTKQYDAAGNSSDGRNYMTPNTVTSSSTNGAVIREVHTIEIIPPLNSNGVYEDLREVWLTLDNHSLQHYINLPGQGDILMTPYRTQMWGGPSFIIPLGEPLWKVIGDTKGNHPIRFTCPKFKQTLALTVSSIYGVTGAGSGGFRIILKGYEYTPAALAEIAKYWNNSVNFQTTDRIVQGLPALTFTYQTPGPLSVETANAYPGGPLQQQDKIFPYWHYARNNQATSPNRLFAFTNLNALAGGTGHVEDTFQDLGFEFNLNNNALLLRGFGVRGVPLPPGQTGSPGYPGQNVDRAGWLIDGNAVPSEEGGNNGIYLTPNVDPMPFGAVSPFIALDNVYYRMPRMPGNIMIYKNNAVPFVVDNGSPIPQDQIAVAVNGILIERV